MENLLLKRTVEPLLAALAVFVKQRRIELGMSQIELANRSGLHRTYVSDVERGNRNLTLGASMLLANGLGVQLKDIVLAIDQGSGKELELERALSAEAA